MRTRAPGDWSLSGQHSVVGTDPIVHESAFLTANCHGCRSDAVQEMRRPTRTVIPYGFAKTGVKEFSLQEIGASDAGLRQSLPFESRPPQSRVSQIYSVISFSLLILGEEWRDARVGVTP
jgi:hypothetical protein